MNSNMSVKIFDRIKLYKKQWITMLLLLLLIAMTYLFVRNDYYLYSDTIGTITSVDTKYTGDQKGPSNEIDKQYSQELKIKIQNGEYKGQSIEVTNIYSESQIKDTQYTKGDDVFLELRDDNGELSASILDSKRDHYVALIALVFVVLLVAIAGKQGVLTLISLAVNIAIYLLIMKRYIQGDSFEILSLIMIISFSVLTLLILGGFNKKSIGAVISSLASVFLITIIYQCVCSFVEKPPYEMMDYIVGHDDLRGIFTGSVIIGSLGAIMDVSITINSSVRELIDTTPHITIKNLIASAREIGHDIMGTMISVLLFTYISGGLPMFILQLRNGYKVLSIIKYNVYFEASRFLLGSIGIVLAIPVSTVVAILMYRKRIREGKLTTKESEELC